MRGVLAGAVWHLGLAKRYPHEHQADNPRRQGYDTAPNDAARQVDAIAAARSFKRPDTAVATHASLERVEFLLRVAGHHQGIVGAMDALSQQRVVVLCVRGVHLLGGEVLQQACPASAPQRLATRRVREQGGEVHRQGLGVPARGE